MDSYSYEKKKKKKKKGNSGERRRDDGKGVPKGGGSHFFDQSGYHRVEKEVLGWKGGGIC